MTASTSKSRVAYIAESSYGTTPATPTFKTFRRTSGQMAHNKGVIESREINLDRNIREVYQVAHDVAGTYEFEASHETLEDFIEGALMSAWSTNSATVGNTQFPFTIEETIDLGGGSFSYLRYLGCLIDRLELSVNARGAMTGSVSFIGQQMQDPATSIISGATYTAANAEAIYTADTVASLVIHSLSPVPVLKSFNISIENNIRLREQIGSLYTLQPGEGQCKISGNFEAYYPSGALKQAILDHDSGEISF